MHADAAGKPNFHPEHVGDRRANFWLKTLSKSRQLQHPCAGRGLPESRLPCPSQHVVLTLLFPSASPNAAAASREPAWLVCCWLPAILSRFPRTVLLYGISIRCAWQAACSPSQPWGFSMLGFASYLCAGSWELGLFRKEFAGQRVELSCATLFLLAVTLTWRQHPEVFGNSQSPWLAPLDPSVHA